MRGAWSGLQRRRGCYDFGVRRRASGWVLGRYDSPIWPQAIFGASAAGLGTWAMSIGFMVSGTLLGLAGIALVLFSLRPVFESIPWYRGWRASSGRAEFPRVKLEVDGSPFSLEDEGDTFTAFKVMLFNGEDSPVSLRVWLRLNKWGGIAYRMLSIDDPIILSSQFERPVSLDSKKGRTGYVIFPITWRTKALFSKEQGIACVLQVEDVESELTKDLWSKTAAPWSLGLAPHPESPTPPVDPPPPKPGS